MKPLVNTSDLSSAWQKYTVHNSAVDVQLLFKNLLFILDCDSENRFYFYITNTSQRRISYKLFLSDYRALSPSIDSSFYRFYCELESACLFHISTVSWISSKNDVFYLDENSSLTASLFTSGVPIFLAKKKDTIPLSIQQMPPNGTLLLQVSPSSQSTADQKYFTLAPVLQTDNSLLKRLAVLCPNYVLADSSVYICQNLGKFYNRFLSFAGEISSDDLEICLSLFSSFFPSISILMEEYQSIELSPQHAERALYFKGLDEEGNLSLSLRWYHEPFDVSFISENKPSFLVRVDHDKKKIEKYDLLYSLDVIGVEILENVLRNCRKNHAQECDEGESLYLIEENNVYISAKLALYFLSENLGMLAKSFRLFGTEALKKYKLKTVSPKTSFRFSSGIDFFDTACTIDIDGDLFSLSEAYDHFEKQHYIPLSDGSRAIIDPLYFKRLKRLLGRQSKNGNYKLSFFDLPLIESLIDAKIEGDEIVHCREIYEGFNSIQNRTLPASALTDTLRSYQKYGAKWLSYLAEHNLGGCLADDMGLGKTIQTISLLASAYGSFSDTTLPSLIVMPKSLIANWQDELKRFAPDLDVYVYYGSDRNLKEAMNHHIVLTTYALVRNDIEELQKQQFEYLILDEVQAIKNTSSQSSKSAVLLNGKHRFALSGTPMENNVGELYSLFRFLNPSMFGSEAEFNREFLTPIQKNGDTQAAQDLSRKISPFMLRRLKQDVAKELPARTEQVCFVDMNEEQARLYERQRKFYQEVISNEIAVNGFEKSSFSILQALLELRQIATVPETKTDGEVVSAKWDILVDNILELAQSGHRCLVFSNFLASLDAVSVRLHKEGIDHLVMTGATSNRAELVRKFQTDKKYTVFLMTLKTGGVGLNLTAADYVYLIDPWWNRSAEQQAIDRTHRIGQDKSIFCYRLIARGTIEEKILELQQKKVDLCASVIASDTQMMKKLTQDDISFLLKENYHGS